MSARVSLSRRDALDVLAVLRGEPVTQWRREALRGVVRDALTPRPKKVAARKATTAAKAKKRATKNEETARLWEQASNRANGFCEACGGGFYVSDPPELDHALGRGRVRQNIRNVWLIHRSCHRSRHAGTPSRQRWLSLWQVHCERHGYGIEAFDAEAKMESAVLSRASAEAGKGGH